MAEKHTEGPWNVGEIRYAGAYQLVVNHRLSGYICEVQAPFIGNEIDADTRTANARLIAAAPDLLAVCEATLDYWQTDGFADCEPGCTCIVDQMRAAIAKARG